MSDLIHQSLDDIAKKLKSDKASKAAPKTKKPVNKGRKTSKGGATNGKSAEKAQNAPVAKAGGKKKNAKQGKDKAEKAKINPPMGTKLSNIPILQRLGPKQETPSGFKVNISNLSVNVVKKDDVKAIFRNCGAIASATILYDRNNRPTGKAEVVFKNENSARKAVAELHKVTVDNIPMNVTFSGAIKPAQVTATPKVKQNQILKQASGANFIIKGIPAKKTPQNGNKTKAKVVPKKKNKPNKNKNAMAEEGK